MTKYVKNAHTEWKEGFKMNAKDKPINEILENYKKTLDKLNNLINDITDWIFSSNTRNEKKWLKIHLK